MVSHVINCENAMCDKIINEFIVIRLATIMQTKAQVMNESQKHLAIHTSVPVLFISIPPLDPYKYYHPNLLHSLLL